MDIPNKRECKNCGGVDRYSDGKCKACVRARVNKYSSQHREEKRAYCKAWREANIDNVREKEKNRAREYRLSHPEKRKLVNKKYVENNKEKIAISKREWKKRNPEAVREMQNRRRSRKGDNVLSRGIIKKLYKLQKGKCPCCNQRLGEDYHLDHIIPLSLGGANTDNNVQLLRASCNLKKHAKDPIQYMQECGFLI